jgi:hypothetical protein
LELEKTFETELNKHAIEQDLCAQKAQNECYKNESLNLCQLLQSTIQKKWLA